MTDVLFRGIRLNRLQEAASVVEQFDREHPYPHKECVTVVNTGTPDERAYYIRRNGKRSISVRKTCLA